MGSRPDALTAAIDAAWRVFDMPAPADLGVCTACCMDPALAQEILATPARRLEARHLEEWLAAAYAPAPYADNMAWLLPRIFELLADGSQVSHLGPEVVLARLPLNGFPAAYSQAAVAAVHSFCLALLEVKLAQRDTTLDAWLCMIAKSGLDLTPFLDRIWALPDAELVALLHSNWIAPWREGWLVLSAFWEDVPARHQLWQWYTSDALLDRLTRAMLADSEPAVELYDLIVAARENPAP